MKHPFDDFLQPDWHVARADQRVVKYGIMLVVLISVATVGAFVVSMGNWRNIAENSAQVATQWNDAQHRVHAYVKTQKELKDVVASAQAIEQLLDGVPRSLLLWEITQSLPQEAMLDDIRLETRRRIDSDDALHIKEIVTLLGVATDDTTISTYIDELSISPYFKNVSLQYAQETRIGTKRQFAIHMEVEREATLAMEVTQ